MSVCFLVVVEEHTSTMDPAFVQFLLFVSRLINLHNTLLIMTDEETISMPICGGISSPIVCLQYPENEGGKPLEIILSRTTSIPFYPIFISDGDHDDLITKLKNHTLLFTMAQVWVMPMRYASEVPSRLDNNILFYKGNSSAGYSVYESYSIKGQNPITRMLFQWHHDATGLPVLPSILDRRTNLNGAVLRDSWVTKTRALGGVQGDVFDDVLLALQAKMNFTLEFIPPKPGKFGRRLKNGSWDGIVGMLTTDDVDLVAGLMLSKGRDTALDFAWPISVLKLTLFNSPFGAPRLNAWAYVNVFPMTAWVTGLATLIVAALCLSLASQESIPQSMTLMGRLFLQIGYDLQMTGLASRGFLITAALCLNMVFIYYTSELTADMTVSPKELSIKSFEDVERLGYQVMGSGPGTLSHNVLRSAAKDSAMMRMVENNYVVSYDSREELFDMVQKILSGDLEEALIWSFASKETKDLKQLDILEAIDIPKTLAFDKDSELTALYNHNIFKMKENGLIHQILTKHTVDPDQAYGVDEPVVIGYENVLFPFGWLALGSLLIVPLLMAEVILGRSRLRMGIKGATEGHHN